MAQYRQEKSVSHSERLVTSPEDNPGILHSFHFNILYWGLGVLVAMLLMRLPESISPEAGCSVAAFVAYVTVILCCTRHSDSFYTPRRLFLITIIFSAFLTASLHIFACSAHQSLYAAGNVSADEEAYEQTVLMFRDMPLKEIVGYFISDIPADDWGAYIFLSLAYAIFPSKILICALYVIIGGFTAVILFRFAKRFVSAPFAFIAALAFCISPAYIVYEATILKEPVFVLIVILFFNSLYKFILDKRNRKSLFYIGIYLLLLLFYRAIITYFLLISALSYIFFSRGTRAKIIIAITVLAIFALIIMFHDSRILISAVGFKIKWATDNYTKVLCNQDTSLIYIFRNWAWVILGQVPNICTVPPQYSRLIPSGGLLYFFYLNLPFWLAVYKILRYKKIIFYPLLFFAFIEMAALGLIMAPESRLAFPHVWIKFFLSFWYFSSMNYAESRLMQKIMTPFFAIASAAMLAWRILKPHLS